MRGRAANAGDRRFKRILQFLSGLAVAVLVLIAVYLLKMSWPAIEEYGVPFFWGTEWNPVKEDFGAGAFIYGTIVSSFLALLMAVPLSISVALFLTELAPRRVAAVVAFLVE